MRRRAGLDESWFRETGVGADKEEEEEEEKGEKRKRGKKKTPPAKVHPMLLTQRSEKKKKQQNASQIKLTNHTVRYSCCMASISLPVSSPIPSILSVLSHSALHHSLLPLFNFPYCVRLLAPCTLPIPFSPLSNPPFPLLSLLPPSISCAHNPLPCVSYFFFWHVSYL